MAHLKKLAHEMHVPLRWLVAGLVCDTFESTITAPQDGNSAFATP
jgi:hypothetical protein